MRELNKRKCSQSTFSMPKTIAQIRPDDYTKDERMVPKAVILVPAHGVLKYLISLLQHLSK